MASIYTSILASYTAIVVDDHEDFRSCLVSMIQDASQEIEIIGEAADGFAAREMINTLKPDLVFMDIDMPGISGIDALITAKHHPFTIFISIF